jgi:hypothetical protein
VTAINPHFQGRGRPPGDPRRATALRAQLRRVAEALSPDWASADRTGDFGAALLDIGARLAEETTRRLDQTVERDAIAFFRFLGLPPTPPRSASGVLALGLATEVERPVFAPARTQVAVTTIAGEQVTFETQHGVRLVPGRIAELVAVDPATDRIEVAQPRVTSLEPSADVPDAYEVVTFAAGGSATVQLTPAVGLAPDDVVRIGTSAHRIEKFDETTGLVTLRDPLEGPAPAGTPVIRIASFETFDMRDVQHHAFHIAHAELFDLEQPAQISVGVAPAELARGLTALDVAYSMYGTLDGAHQPAWQPLELLGTSSGEIQLAKTWVGTVDKVEVQGLKSRWLRAELREPVRSRQSPAASASQVWLRVVSDTAPTGAGSTPPATAGTGQPEVREGSDTIVRAFHNGTPLSTAGRFLPFGPEPLRFDAFSVAAPEALSKKGATATVTVEMVDSSLTSLDIAPTTAGGSTFTGYGAGRNGDLQIVSLDDGDGPRWRGLKAVTDDGRRILVSGVAPIGAAATDGAEVVVVTDRDGGLWSARIRPSGDQAAPSVDGGWLSLPALTAASSTDLTSPPPNGRPTGPTVAPTPSGILGVAAILLDVRRGQLHALPLTDNGQAVRADWQPVDVTPRPAPALVGAWQITAVQGADWPRRASGTSLELVAIDPDGALWCGQLTTAPGQRATVDWRRLPDTGRGRTYEVSPEVSPAATRFRDPSGTTPLFVAYASPDPADLILHGLIDANGVTTHLPEPDSARLEPGTGLHSNPAAGSGGHPAAAGLGPRRETVVLWYGARATVALEAPDTPDTRRPLVLPTATSGIPELVLGGSGERLFRASVGLLASFRLHNLLELNSKDVAHRVRIVPPSGSRAGPTLVELGAGNRRIHDGDLRIYQYNGPLAANWTLEFLRLTPFDDPGYVGTVGSLPTQLQLDPSDTGTRADMRVIIDGVAYTVTGVSSHVATLESPLPVTGQDLSYRPATLLASRTVAATDLGTLVELAHDAIVDPPVLDFGLRADPVTQDLTLQQNDGKVVWGRLRAAWAGTRPPDGRVALPGSATSVTWTVARLDRGYQNPELSWEYFDGRGWRRLDTDFLDGTDNLATSGAITFVVPDDLSTTEIGGSEDYWIRARLIGGDYGRPTYVVQEETTGDGTTTRTVTVDTSGLHPPEVLSIEATFDLRGRTAPEILLVDNNLDVLDQTQAAATSAARFALFQGAIAVDPHSAERAVFIGFTTAVESGSLSLFVDAADQPGEESLRVDVRAADGWRPVSVDDRTRSLRRRGTVTVTLDVDPGRVRVFGQDRFWLRFRPTAPGGMSSRTGPDAALDQWAPVVHGLYCNTVTISQAKTIEDEILGSSLGEPGLTVTLAETPVLPDTVDLRVRERLDEEEQAALAADLVVRGEHSQAVVSADDRMPGTWVLWRRVDSFVGCTGDDRVYVLDASSGQVAFGDARRGKIPPAGRDGIRAFSYQRGGGEAGNLPAWQQAKLTSAVEGVDTVVLPVDTAGGFSQPEATSLLATAPQRLRHGGRALTPADVEAVAVGSSSDIVRARCARPTSPGAPMRITIAVRDGSRSPMPTLSQREAVAALIREVGWGGLGDGSIEVSGPTYVRVGVTVQLLAAPELLSDVEDAARTVLADLLHPVDGGPSGTGWPFGRPPAASDLLRALAGVRGLDRVDAVRIAALGNESLDAFPDDGLVSAETSDIDVVVRSAEGAP